MNDVPWICADCGKHPCECQALVPEGHTRISLALDCVNREIIVILENSDGDTMLTGLPPVNALEFAEQVTQGILHLEMNHSIN